MPWMRDIIVAAAAAGVVALAGCDERGAAETALAATEDPLAAYPSWASALVGKPLAGAFPTRSSSCQGHVDAVHLRHDNRERPGAVVAGWGWDSAAGKPVERVLMVDDEGRIVGAAEGGRSRPDVPKARPNVTSQNTGWEGPAGVVTGAVTAFGLTAGPAVCQLGALRL